MGISTNGTSKLFQAVSISGLLLVGGLLVSTGRVLSTVDTNTQTIGHVEAEVKEIREYIDMRTHDRYTAGDAAKDLAYIDARLSRIEKFIDGQGKK